MKNIKRYIVAIAAIASITACQKMDKPPLGEFQTDEPIVGDLKFYVPFNGDFVEDMKKSIGKGQNTSFVAGIQGEAVQLTGADNSIITMRTTNDFRTATSLTVSYWLKLSAPDKSGAQFIFSNPTLSGEWPGANVFQLMEDGGQSNNGLMATKFVVHGNWLEFVGANRIAGVMDNQWHHWVLRYSETTSLMEVFVDGKKQALTKRVDNAGAPYGKANLSQSEKFVIGGPPHIILGTTPDSWMTTFKGGVDQFRLYSKALTDAEITALYTNKE